MTLIFSLEVFPYARIISSKHGNAPNTHSNDLYVGFGSQIECPTLSLACVLYYIIILRGS